MITNEFIKENISSINKNKIMLIDLGKNISDSIFTNKHTYQNIKTIISSINSNNNCSIKINKSEIVKSYFKNNIILEVYNKKINNYSYIVSSSNTFSHNNLDYKVSIININNSPNITSNYKYNMIEKSIETIINYNNILDIIIKQYTKKDSFCRFIIKIKKPIEYDILINEINYIISLFG